MRPSLLSRITHLERLDLAVEGLGLEEVGVCAGGYAQIICVSTNALATYAHAEVVTLTRPRVVAILSTFCCEGKKLVDGFQGSTVPRGRSDAPVEVANGASTAAMTVDHLRVDAGLLHTLLYE